jgi:hypothetical protein
LNLLYEDDFDESDLSDWLLGPGWGLVLHDSGQALQLFNNNSAAILQLDPLYSLAVEADWGIEDGVARLSIRQSQVGAYALELDASGALSLLRAGQLMESVSTAPSQPGQVRRLHLSAIDDVLRVMVDGTEIFALRDSAPLPPGAIGWSGELTTLEASGSPNNSLLIDNLAVYIPAIATEPAAPGPTLTETPEPAATWPAESVSPDLAVIHSNNFDSGDLLAWSVSAGAELVPQPVGQALQVLNTNDITAFEAYEPYNTAIEARVLLDHGAARLLARLSNVGAYAVTLDAAGQLSLYRGADLWQSTTVSASVPGQWRRLRLSVIHDTVSVHVDDVTVIQLVDAANLPPGKVAVGGAFELVSAAVPPANTVLIDDVQIFVRRTRSRIILSATFRGCLLRPQLRALMNHSFLQRASLLHSLSICR